MAENMIKFLRGNVASLPATATAGAVYFTKDEGLYLGLADGTYHRYGDFIEVANVDALPEEGANVKAMYYCAQENILAKWDGAKWVQINKQKTLAELGGVAKSVYEAKVAALEAKDTAIDKQLAGFGADEGSVKAYVDAVDKVIDDHIADGTKHITSEERTKLAGIEEGAQVNKIEKIKLNNVELTITDKTIDLGSIATTAGLDELANRVTNLDKEGGRVAVVEGKVAALEEATDTYALKTELEAATLAVNNKIGTMPTGEGAYTTLVGGIAAAKSAADAAQSTADSKIDAAGVEAYGYQTAAQVASAIAGAGHAVKSEVDAAIAGINNTIGTVEEGKTVVEMIADAEYDDAALVERVGAVEGEVNTIKGDYLKAADKTELQGNIDKKVEQSAYDAKVSALEGEDLRLAGLITDMDTAYKAADKALGERIDAIDTAMGGLTGAMHFKGKLTEMPTDLSAYAAGDVIIVGNKEYVFNNGAFVELGDVTEEGARIQVLEEAVNGKEGVKGLKTLVSENAQAVLDEKARAEGKEAELAQADIDNLAAAKQYTNEEITKLNISQYATQSALDELTTKHNDYETAHANDYTNSKVDELLATKAAKSVVDEHTADADIHVTAAQKEAWSAAEKNAKDYADGKFEEKGVAQGLVDGLGIGDYLKKTEAEGLYAVKGATEAHIADTDIHVTTADKTKWNGAQAAAEANAAAALEAAKTELEGKITAEATARGTAISGVETAYKAADKVLSDKIDVINGSGEGSFAKADAALKTELTEEINKKANASDVYAKAEVEAMLTWGTF